MFVISTNRQGLSDDLQFNYCTELQLLLAYAQGYYFTPFAINNYTIRIEGMGANTMYKYNVF